MKPQPGFVIVGGPLLDGRVCLWASTALTEAELKSEVRPHGWTRHSLTAEMDNYVTVVANSWSEAFSTLFGRWTPQDQQVAIRSAKSIARKGRR